MRLIEITEGAFDSMVDQLDKAPKKSPGRWPGGSKSKKDQEANKGQSMKKGDVTKHTAGLNYSGERSSEVDSGHHVVYGAQRKKKELDQLVPPKKRF